MLTLFFFYLFNYFKSGFLQYLENVEKLGELRISFKKKWENQTITSVEGNMKSSGKFSLLHISLFSQENNLLLRSIIDYTIPVAFLDSNASD